MKNIPFLILLAMIATIGIASAAIVTDYPSDRMMLPNSETELFLNILNSGNEQAVVSIKCISELKTECPSRVSLQAGEAASVKAAVYSGNNSGSFLLTFNINGEIGDMNIRVSEAPLTLFRIIEAYNESLTSLLKDDAGKNDENLIAAGLLVRESYRLYHQEDYLWANEIVKQIGEKLPPSSRGIADNKISLVPKPSLMQGLSIASIQESIEYFYVEPIVYYFVFSGIFLLIIIAITARYLPDKIRKKEKVNFSPGILDLRQGVKGDNMGAIKSEASRAKKKRKSSALFNELFKN